MRKFLAMGALALSLALASERPASAWVNWKFGAGVNMNWQSGGNNLFWGMFRNGQPPGPDCVPPGMHLPPGVGFPGGPNPYAPNQFQFFGNQPANPNQAPQFPATTTANDYVPHNGVWIGNAAFRTVNYTQPAYYYYYPQYGYGAQVPAYWYGR